MSRLQFVSLVRQTTPEGEKDFFFNGKEWQRLSAPPQPAPEPGVAPEEEASADTLPEPQAQVAGTCSKLSARE